MSDKLQSGGRRSMLDMAESLSKLGRSVRLPQSVTGASRPSRAHLEAPFFTSLPQYREMKRVRAVADVVGFESPYFKVHDGKSGARCIIDGKSYINFASYDYLGLNGAPSVTAAAHAAIETYGTSVSASRPTAGDRPLHGRLERKIAEVYETEDALTFVSGHGTNVSVIGELLGPRDLILFDALCHNSIVLGTKLSQSARQSFPHNDMAALERLLETSRGNYERVLIVVEGLYSMDGDVALLPELIEIKRRHGAWLMVDEAHSLGVLGRTGRGVFEHSGVAPDGVDIWMGTLSKTLSACGGYIAGPRALIEVLKFNASAFMFSVGMSPPVAAAALAALELMLAEPDRAATLKRNGELFLACSREAGLDTGTSAGFAIGVVMVGDSIRAVKLAERLFARGINAIPVTYPAVPMKAARLRFFLTSEHSEDDIRALVRIVREELGELHASKFGLGAAAAAMIGALS